jgi:hypothetical protein
VHHRCTCQADRHMRDHALRLGAFRGRSLSARREVESWLASKRQGPTPWRANDYREPLAYRMMRLMTGATEDGLALSYRLRVAVNPIWLAIALKLDPRYLSMFGF